VELFVEILDRVAHVPHVRLTFDDGNASDFELALPEITKRGLYAEFFVLAGRIGQTGYLDASQLRGLLAAGMGVGLHGMAHRSWAECDDAQLEVEIDEARRLIEAVTGRSVTRAACPFGAYNARCLRKLKRSGFECVYTSDGGIARENEWLQCRNTLQRHHRIEYVKAMVEQPTAGLRDLRRRFRTFVKSKRGSLLP
jgi:peptidoglycan/xylan/chitin deacetylase (PgdA/CDA1 family)